IRTTSEVISATCTCPAGGTPTFCKQVFAAVYVPTENKDGFCKSGDRSCYLVYSWFAGRW
ncbi:hypothetical protein TNCT_675821, partial [Trichonephila clavata]